MKEIWRNFDGQPKGNKGSYECFGISRPKVDRTLTISELVGRGGSETEFCGAASRHGAMFI